MNIYRQEPLSYVSQLDIGFVYKFVRLSIYMVWVVLAANNGMRKHGEVEQNDVYVIFRGLSS